MSKKQFKSESKRILDLMINSIYTNKDIFLRELISNSSDALDKLYYESLTNKELKVKKSDLAINLSVNEVNKAIIIEDNGIGMTEEELDNNLGTIARSGSLAFKEMMDDNKKVDIIGQFGVGFYSAFMVSKKIVVESKSIKSENGYTWSSDGENGYTIEKNDKKNNGTKITLYLKDDTEDVKYSDYLTEYKIRSLVTKYSDYIRYPIRMNVTKKENDKEVMSEETLNSMIPLWKKNKKDIKEEDYNNFYSDKYYDFEKPIKVIHTQAEGLCSYKALLFIPGKLPMDFYTKEFEPGLSLYSNGVLIMDKCKDLLPDYLSFVRGVVDTEDVSLNISREMLQQTKSIQLIEKNIDSKVRKELEDMLNNDREKYIEFFKVFGPQLKFGIYNNFGMDKDKLKDLILFYSSKKKDYVTLKEYVSNMKENQDSIYYASGESIEKIDNLPQVEQVKEKDYEILYLTDYIDEFAISALMEYDNKKFSNVKEEKLDLEDESKKEETKKLNDDNKDLLNIMKESINVSEVRFTNKLKNHPVCLTTKGNISLEMEKVINAMPTDEKIKAEEVLEINENHKIKDKLIDLYNNNKDELKKYTKILYSEARLIEGLQIDNPTEISNLICDIISK
ncbi:MAG: molecular chaperone HtpG [Bacilli bacterium]|nr:molecular chaperone HtpG [Bacilli bacterium]